jgi:hypothetical protein
VTGGQLTSLKKALTKVKANLAEHIRIREEEISDLRKQIVEMEKQYRDALAEKNEKEPDTYTVPGLLHTRGKPAGIETEEEWHELRKAGKHLEYL